MEEAGSETRFVADVMLGRLARWLRALGCDTLYFRDASDSRLLGIALRERRCLLTRDAALAARAGTSAVLIRAEGLDAQLREVATQCGLGSSVALSRCLECNGRLLPRAAEEVRDRVPPYTLDTQAAFRECPGCGRIFWAGTHMVGIMARLGPFLAPGGSRAVNDGRAREDASSQGSR